MTEIGKGGGGVLFFIWISILFEMFEIVVCKQIDDQL